MKARHCILILFVLFVVTLCLLEAVCCQAISFETMAQGEVSYFRYGDSSFNGSDMIIRDDKTWKEFWIRHTLGLIPKPPRPKVDFRREMVLVVLQGYQASGGGPAIEIVSIDELTDGDGAKISGKKPRKGILVSVEENREPGHLTVVTNPYHIVKMERGHPSVLFQRQRIGNSCMDNTSCQEREFCQKSVGDCSEPGVCKVRPEACIEIYDPVCGCDGKTYGNLCLAAQAGVSPFAPGTCEGTVCMKNENCPSNEFCLFAEGKCAGSGICTPKPKTCPLYFAPCRIEDSLCGCDGITYCNACEDYLNGVSIFHKGACKKECIESGGK